MHFCAIPEQCHILFSNFALIEKTKIIILWLRSN